MGIESLWVHVTDLGDSAVLLPLALVIFLWLGLQSWRIAALWAGLFGLDGAVVALSKILYMGWGLHPAGWNFTGLSGHSALSMLVWPTIGMLLAVGRRRFWRLALPLAGAVLSAAIVVSRLAIDVHTPPEAGLGALWGGVLAGVFLVLSRKRRAAPSFLNPHGGRAGRSPALGALSWNASRCGLSRPGLLLPLALILPLALTYGEIFPSTPLLEDVACRLSGHAQPYTRSDLERQLAQ